MIDDIRPYRIVGPLGRGSMGTVYKAVDQTLDRDVAIKIVSPDLNDPEIMQRFRADVTILTNLHHPAIAECYAFVHSDAGLLMVTEFVRGQTLEAMVERLGALPPDHAVYIIDEVLSALADADRAGIVHGDMKPTNVMVTDHGAVKVLDFGMSRVCGSARATAESHLMSAPAYMPPEQVLGQPVDGRADVYAVGVMLYRLLTGTLPFTAEIATAVQPQVISHPPTPPRVYREGLPDWGNTIVQRALAKSPDDRFQTAEDFREALGRATSRLTTRPTRALGACVAGIGTTAATEPSVLERSGPTEVPLAPYPTDMQAASRLFVPLRDPTAASDTPPGPTTADVLEEAANCAMVVVREQHLAWLGSILVAVVGGFVLLAAAVAWRPVTLATTKADAIRAVASPTAPVQESVKPSPSASPQSTPGGPTSAPPLPTAPVQESVKPSPNASPQSTRGGPTSAAPLTFDAKALVGAANQQRKSLVILADGKIFVRDSDDHQLLHVVPYADVISISYSRGRNPLWNAPTGPAPVARTGGFGILGGERYWVSLHTKSGKSPFIVLRLADNTEAQRAVTALEQRTGRKAVFVVERKNGV